MYWDNFYKKEKEKNFKGLDSPSNFAITVQEILKFPKIVLDLGAGNGRDSLYFLQSNNVVLAVDSSEHSFSIVELYNHDTLHTLKLDLTADNSAFLLLETIKEIKVLNDFPVLFYLRFFLHAIEPENQGKIFNLLSKITNPGDIIAFENRVDSKTNYYYSNHNRYPIKNIDIRKNFSKSKYKTILDIEDTGLAIFFTEDPTIGRLILEKI